jgi:hypothetical protein
MTKTNEGINGVLRPYMLTAEPIPLNKLHDPSLPGEDDHLAHLDKVIAASKGWGFPVAPCARQWPPETAKVVRKAVRA